MTSDQLGQTFALLSAVTWAFALVLFKRSGERIPPIALNLYKNAVGLVLLTATLGFLFFLGRYRLDLLTHHAAADLCLLMFSGVIGIALADTVFFYSLNLIGVGLISIVDCLYAPLAVLFAWLLLAEKLSVFHYLGGGLIVAGVVVASQYQLPVNRTRRQIAVGALLAALAVAMMTFGIVLAKPVLEPEDMPLVWASTLRLGAGTGFLALFALLGPGWRRHWSAFRPSASWRTALPASLLGTYICTLLWIAGYKYTFASIAAALNQTSVIFACILAALLLKEPFGRRQVAALILALSGVAIVTFGGALRAALAF